MRCVVLCSVLALSFAAVAACASSEDPDPGLDKNKTEPAPIPSTTSTAPRQPPRDSGTYSYDAGRDSGDGGADCDMSDFMKLAEWGQELASGNAPSCPCTSSTQCCFLGQACVSK
jgi:hypothetical protein